MTDSARLIATSSQTLGPFFHFGLAANAALGVIAVPASSGERIELRIRVLDGAGAPVSDALIELYQADGDGRYVRPDARGGGFSGFGRLPTDAGGWCRFQTILSGVVPAGDTAQAPHVNVCLLSRGLLRQIYTRLYFDGDPGLMTDPLLAIVPAERRPTLLARPEPGNPGAWTFVIRLQGDDETVFFDL
jgi:protocatechuate 3,4-dioxygenase, alpha subunit